MVASPALGYSKYRVFLSCEVKLIDVGKTVFTKSPLQKRNNEHDGVSIHQPQDCWLNVYSGADQRKHQSSASPAFVRGIHRWPMNSPHKWPVTREMFPSDDVMHGSTTKPISRFHDDVIKWKYFPPYWPFMRKFTGHRWIPLTKVSDAELWCFLISASE